ncbi:hypothetical protein CRG98_007886 [Punica granatum]|nr:hypothetical protein CRG98_007886 [Punica granatum]
MGWMAVNNPEQDDTGETFAQRAESYYQKRPQLLAFLQDLYRAYISLSDRYVQLLSKNNRAQHSRQSSQVSTITTDNDSCSSENDHREDHSDAESSLSFQQPLQPYRSSCELFNFDVLVAEIVIKNVECDILLHEVEISSRKSNDASRKIELQRSLLEVLESERLILLNENARLGYRMNALIEENRELGAESMFVKTKAGELARSLLKLKEDQRVCALSRKIEDLQGQIHGLEKRNKEYYEQLVRRELEAEVGKGKKGKRDGKSGSSREVDLDVCFQMERFKLKPSLRVEEGKVFGWWEKIKRMDIFMCGTMPTGHGC